MFALVLIFLTLFFNFATLTFLWHLYQCVKDRQQLLTLFTCSLNACGGTRLHGGGCGTADDIRHHLSVCFFGRGFTYISSVWPACS